MPPKETPGIPGTRLPEPAVEVDARRNRDRDELRDSRETTQETLLNEYREAAEARRAAEAKAAEAEARARAAELKMAAAEAAKQDAESGVTALGPSFSLGSAKWWVLVLGALCMVGSCAANQYREYMHPPVTAAQLEDVHSHIRELGAKVGKADESSVAAEDKNRGRWAIAISWLCVQGLRARNLDCDAAQDEVEFAPQPLSSKVHGTPQWRTSSTWPALPPPPKP